MAVTRVFRVRVARSLTHRQAPAGSCPRAGDAFGFGRRDALSTAACSVMPPLMTVGLKSRLQPSRKSCEGNDRRVSLAGRLPVRRSTCSRPELTIAGARDLPPPSDRRRLSPKLLCLNLLRELHALLRTELFCPRFLAPLIGRAECLRRFLILCSILLQSTITGHPDLLLQQPQFGLPCVGTT